MEGYITLLPPVFLSISGLIILMFKAIPYKISKRLLPLLTIIYIISIWIIYLLVLFLIEQYIFFDPSITIFFLILGLTFFILAVILITSKRKIRCLIISIIFCLGVVFTLIGFTNYISSKGKTVLFFKAYHQNKVFSVTSKSNNSRISYPVFVYKGYFGYGIILESNFFNQEIKTLKVIYGEDGKDYHEFTIKNMRFKKWGMADVYILDKSQRKNK